MQFHISNSERQFLSFILQQSTKEVKLFTHKVSPSYFQGKILDLNQYFKSPILLTLYKVSYLYYNGKNSLPNSFKLQYKEIYLNKIQVSNQETQGNAKTIL